MFVEYLKGCLKRWLPKTKMQERYQDHRKESNTDHRKSW